jgi:hypothetical protein
LALLLRLLGQRRASHLVRTKHTSSVFAIPKYPFLCRD